MFIFPSLFLFVVVYFGTVVFDIIGTSIFLMHNRFGQRMSTWPKPFSCSACLSGWINFLFWGAMGLFAGFPYVSIPFALLAAFLAARFLNSSID